MTESEFFTEEIGGCIPANVTEERKTRKDLLAEKIRAMVAEAVVRASPPKPSEAEPKPEPVKLSEAIQAVLDELLSEAETLRVGRELRRL